MTYNIQRDDSTDRFIDDMYGAVIIAGLEYGSAQALFEVDPIAYREIQADLESVAEFEPLDVWMKFDNPYNVEDVNYDDGDKELTHEANTYQLVDGFAIDWYLTAVGQITRIEFDTLEAAHQWYADNGFEDFSS